MRAKWIARVSRDEEDEEDEAVGRLTLVVLKHPWRWRVVREGKVSERNWVRRVWVDWQRKEGVSEQRRYEKGQGEETHGGVEVGTRVVRSGRVG